MAFFPPPFPCSVFGGKEARTKSHPVHSETLTFLLFLAFEKKRAFG